MKSTDRYPHDGAADELRARPLQAKSLLGYRRPLDGVRAVAVGMVMIVHTDRSILPTGALGVDLFFVLSGFLITTLLLE